MTDKTNTGATAADIVDEEVSESVESDTTPTRRQKILGALRSVAIIGGAAGIALAASTVVDNVSQQALDHWWPVKEDEDSEDDEPVLAIEAVPTEPIQIESFVIEEVHTDK